MKVPRKERAEDKKPLADESFVYKRITRQVPKYNDIGELVCIVPEEVDMLVAKVYPACEPVAKGELPLMQVYPDYLVCERDKAKAKDFEQFWLDLKREHGLELVSCTHHTVVFKNLRAPNVAVFLAPTHRSISLDLNSAHYYTRIA